MSEMEELIKKYLNEKGKLDCSDGFKIAAKLKCSTLEVGACAKAMDIRIDSCELGQFGKLEGGIYDLEAENRLKPLLDEKNRVTCKAARAAAAGIGLKKIRGTLKEKNYDVTFCELGCFKEKLRPRLYVKTKTWIENAEGELLFGKGKTEILELIEQEGSISKASEKIGMNYKKSVDTHQNLATQHQRYDGSNQTRWRRRCRNYIDPCCTRIYGQLQKTSSRHRELCK